MKPHQRNPAISIAKGIGMIFVVCGHFSGAPSFYPFFPYAFHMGFFFFLAGLVCSAERMDNYFEFVSSRLAGLGVPYLLYFLLINSIGIGLTWLTGNNFGSPGLVSISNVFIDVFLSAIVTPLFFTSWFLASLLVVSLAGILLHLTLKKAAIPAWVGLTVLMPLALISISYGQSSSPDRFLNLAVCKNVVALTFFWAGHLLNGRNFPGYMGSTAFLTVAFFFQYALVISGIPTGYFMATNTYYSLWMPFLSTIGGAAVVLSISFIARHLSYSDLLVRAGDDSLHIMALHPLALQLTSLAFALYAGVPLSQLSMSNIYASANYWPVFILTGMLLPLVAISGARLMVRSIHGRMSGAGHQLTP